MASKKLYVIEWQDVEGKWHSSTDGAPWHSRDIALERALDLSQAKGSSLKYRVTTYVSTREDY